MMDAKTPLVERGILENKERLNALVNQLLREPELLPFDNDIFTILCKDEFKTEDKEAILIFFSRQDIREIVNKSEPLRALVMDLLRSTCSIVEPWRIHKFIENLVSDKSNYDYNAYFQDYLEALIKMSLTDGIYYLFDGGTLDILISKINEQATSELQAQCYKLFVYLKRIEVGMSDQLDHFASYQDAVNGAAEILSQQHEVDSMGFSFLPEWLFNYIAKHIDVITKSKEVQVEGSLYNEIRLQQKRRIDIKISDLVTGIVDELAKPFTSKTIPNVRMMVEQIQKLDPESRIDINGQRWRVKSILEYIEMWIARHYVRSIRCLLGEFIEPNNLDNDSAPVIIAIDELFQKIEAVDPDHYITLAPEGDPFSPVVMSSYPSGVGIQSKMLHSKVLNYIRNFTVIKTVRIHLKRNPNTNMKYLLKLLSLIPGNAPDYLIEIGDQNTDPLYDLLFLTDGRHEGKWVRIEDVIDNINRMFTEEEV